MEFHRFLRIWTGFDAKFEPHTVRLFPKFLGSAAYIQTGVAARCDWVVLTDSRDNEAVLMKNTDTEEPRHVFLSMRSPFKAIEFFATDVLPVLRSPYVLVSGSEDTTLPRQIDKRWRAFNEDENEYIAAILEHPALLHWYVENLSDDACPKLSPLPTGMVFPESRTDVSMTLPRVTPQRKREMTMFCGHRHREGPQWGVRKQVSEMAVKDWVDFTEHLSGEISPEAFSSKLNTHSFVVCVEGGGIDPSPKAWQALLHGAIPIIRKTPLSKAYSLLPVVMIPDWASTEISRDRLRNWKEILMPWFDSPRKRRVILKRLGRQFWWDYIESGRVIAPDRRHPIIAVDCANNSRDESPRSD